MFKNWNVGFFGGYVSFRGTNLSFHFQWDVLRRSLTWLICVRHNSLICHMCVMWSVHMCDMSHLMWVWKSEVHGMTHTCVTWLIYVWHDSFIWYMTLSYVMCVCRDVCIRVTRLIRRVMWVWKSEVHGMTHTCVTWLNLCVPWLFHMSYDSSICPLCVSWRVHLHDVWHDSWDESCVCDNGKCTALVMSVLILLQHATATHTLLQHTCVTHYCNTIINVGGRIRSAPCSTCQCPYYCSTLLQHTHYCNTLL